MKKTCFIFISLLFSYGQAWSSDEGRFPEFNRHETQSFFEPGVGTHNIVYQANGLPVISSGVDFPGDIIVSSDVGTNISRYSADGRLEWRIVTYPDTVREITISEGILIAFAGERRLYIDPDSGDVIDSVGTGSAFLFNRMQDGVHISGLNAQGDGAVSINGEPLQVETRYARSALINDGNIYIADTFNHRVVVIDLESLHMVDSRRFYYPNDLYISQGDVKVVEEHANRIVDFYSGEIEFSCPIWAYMQTDIDVQSIEKDVVKYNSYDGVGRCAREFMGVNTLYSPNGAVYHDGHLIVADTDNHRVVSIFEGEVVSELININNPVRIIMVP